MSSLLHIVQLSKITLQIGMFPHLSADIINQICILPSAEDNIFSKKYALLIAEDNNFITKSSLPITEDKGFIQKYCHLSAEGIVFKQTCPLLSAEDITFRQKWSLPQMLKPLLVLACRLFCVGFSPLLAKNSSGKTESYIINLPGIISKWNTPGFKN